MNNSITLQLCDTSVVVSRRQASEDVTEDSHGVAALSLDLPAREEQSECADDWWVSPLAGQDVAGGG
jgi:hypothetical protein